MACEGRAGVQAFATLLRASWFLLQSRKGVYSTSLGSTYRFVDHLMVGTELSLFKNNGILDLLPADSPECR